MNPPARRLYSPRPAAVEASGDGVPVAVGPVAVETVREEWLVEDRWWTPRPLRRRYFELVLADGRDVVVFSAEDEAAEGPGARARWFLQRA